MSFGFDAVHCVRLKAFYAASHVRLKNFLRRLSRGAALRDLSREAECLLRELDRQIDALVYDLYALTPAEIKIVEGVTA
jgi:hypothetical protein